MIRKSKYFSGKSNEHGYHMVYVFTDFAYKTGIVLWGLGVSLFVACAVVPLLNDTGYSFSVSDGIQSSMSMLSAGTILILTYALGAAQERAHERQHAAQMFPHRLEILKRFEEHIHEVYEIRKAVSFNRKTVDELNDEKHIDCLFKLEQICWELLDYWPEHDLICFQTHRDIYALRLTLQGQSNKGDEKKAEVIKCLEGILEYSRKLRSKLRGDLFKTVG